MLVRFSGRSHTCKYAVGGFSTCRENPGYRNLQKKLQSQTCFSPQHSLTSCGAQSLAAIQFPLFDYIQKITLFYKPQKGKYLIESKRLMYFPRCWGKSLSNIFRLKQFKRTFLRTLQHLEIDSICRIKSKIIF